MPGKFQFHLDDREFQKTLAVYKGMTKRDRPVITNTKAFYIARAAVYFTPKADSASLLSELRGARLKAKTLKNGAVKNFNYTLAQLIVLARRTRDGLPTSRAELAEAVKALLAARKRSVAFLKSGWLPAIKGLESLAERPGSAKPLDKTAGQVGRPKGRVTPAREGMVKTVTTITNMADAKHDSKGALIKFGGPGLQQAIDHEAQSMRDYIEAKLRKRASEAGIKHH